MLACEPLPAYEARWGRERVGAAVGEALQELRARLAAGEDPDVSPAAVAALAGATLDRWVRPSLRRVINATGVVLHTNLGRAPLGRAALRALAATAGAYTNLEFDLETGERGSRHVHAIDLVRRLTGAEAVLVVNNNAAAVLLALAAVAAGREVVVSRGELVEIGGSFRVPEVMAQSGARLHEVGATNRTHLRDYEAAIGPETAALLKVHRSNFRLVGFTSEVEAAELVALGRRAGLPVLFDLGSGSLLALADEPPVQAALAAGCDLVTFSGDKLLGGPQAGIVCGRAEWVERCRRHPLARALRVGKLTLAALEATLLAYLEPGGAAREVPAVGMLLRPAAEVRLDAERLAEALAPLVAVEVVESVARAGGGSLPEVDLPSAAVAVRAEGVASEELARRLRRGDPPVVARIHEDRLHLDPRTLLPGDAEELVRRVREALG